MRDQINYEAADFNSVSGDNGAWARLQPFGLGSPQI